MLDALKEFINFLSNPWLSFTLTIVLFFVALRLRWVWTWWFFGLVMLGTTVFLWMGFTDPYAGAILKKADNAPIVIMLYAFPLFLWVAMIQAVNNDRRMEQGGAPEEKSLGDQKTWTWPDLVYIEFIAVILFTVALVVWSLTVPAPLERPANPGNTPNPSKAPWYFLGLQEMLVYFDPWYAGVVLPSIIILGLCAIPYVDVNVKAQGYYSFKERRLAIGTFLFGFYVLWIFLIITGTILRGPGWNFFGPFEEWTAHKVVALNNVNLSDVVWIKLFYNTLYPATGIEWFGQGLPEVQSKLPWEDFANLGRCLMREAPGLIALGLYYLVLPGVLAKTLCRTLYAQLGWARYSVVIFLFLTMFTMPLKMYLRWVVNLQYFVATPWINF